MTSAAEAVQALLAVVLDRVPPQASDRGGPLDVVLTGDGPLAVAAHAEVANAQAPVWLPRVLRITLGPGKPGIAAHNTLPGGAGCILEADAQSVWRLLTAPGFRLGDDGLAFNVRGDSDVLAALGALCAGVGAQSGPLGTLLAARTGKPLVP